MPAWTNSTNLSVRGKFGPILFHVRSSTYKTKALLIYKEQNIESRSRYNLHSKTEHLSKGNCNLTTSNVEICAHICTTSSCTHSLPIMLDTLLES